ncbi:hypothetical protein [Mycolicibacterium sp. J2]|uniref:hypothetical protein n=1 Tax=Mycolicibacterium sp. J2 TaxID=2993511 RepID=UPI00224AE143|nr:hypothetical protein [Mycolicibacterium sp. J2]MCX2716111.1 hypothetical protein [Mycolicibacterium sp. J2]
MTDSSRVAKLSDVLAAGRVSEADLASFQFVQRHKALMDKDTPWLHLGLELKEATLRVVDELKQVEGETA